MAPRYNVRHLHTRLGLLAALVAGVALPGAAAAASINMGAAAGYVVLGLNGTHVNLHNVKVTGTVGVGPAGKVSLKSPSSVSGDIIVDATATVNENAGTLGGSLVTGQNLAAAVAAALQVASDAAAMAPTQVLGNVNSTRVVNGNGGTNVISIGSISLSGSNSLYLSGTANDVFILNVTGGISMGGSAQIVGLGNVGANQILINVIGTGTKLTSHVDNYIAAILLAPQRSVEFHSYSGQVIAGGTELKLMSGASAVEPPPVAVEAKSWSRVKDAYR